jgi:hypothetical protein
VWVRKPSSAQQRPDLGEDGFRFVLEALLGDAQDAVAGDL